jgi:TolB-like protein
MPDEKPKRKLPGVGVDALFLNAFSNMLEASSEQLRSNPDLPDPLNLGGLASFSSSVPQQFESTPLGPSIPDKPSIVVLPFANMSSDVEQAYFVDGLTDDLITDLSKVPQLFVIARNSSFAYKGRSIDIRQIARELGVKYVLEGSARRAADRVRINAQLIDAAAGGHIWADRFDRDLADIFAAVDEVIGKIVEALVGKLAAASLKERYRPASLEAYDLCLRGRAEWVHSPKAGVEAIPLFERAIALDPNYADAYRWLSLSQGYAWIFMNCPMDPYRQLSMASAKRAVELDPDDSGAHWVLALVLLYERHWDESAKEFEISLRLNPNDADAWASLADLKVYEGRGVEAIACIQKALRLNPYPPSYYFWTLGFAQFAAGQYEAAVKTLRNEATYRTESRFDLAAALAQLGQLEEARLEANLYLAGNPQFRISRWLETQSFRDMATRDRFLEGYRKAGLPE